MYSFNHSITAELEAETQAIEAIKTGIRQNMNGSDFSFFDILDTLQEEGFYHYGSGHTEIVSAALIDMVEDKEIIETGEATEERGFELYRLNVPMVHYYQIGQTYKEHRNYYRGRLNAAMRWLYVCDMCALLSIEGLKASGIVNYYANDRITLPQLSTLEMLALLAWAVKVGFLCEENNFYTLNVKTTEPTMPETIAA